MLEQEIKCLRQLMDEREKANQRAIKAALKALKAESKVRFAWLLALVSLLAAVLEHALK